MTESGTPCESSSTVSLLREARRGDTRPQVVEIRLGDLDREWPDRGVARWAFDRGSHVVLLDGDGGVVTGRSLLVSFARRPRRERWVAYGGCSLGCSRLRVIPWERETVRTSVCEAEAT